MSEPEIPVVSSESLHIPLPLKKVHTTRNLVFLLVGVIAVLCILGIAGYKILHNSSPASSVGTDTNRYDENQIHEMLQGTHEEKLTARDFIFSHPESINPFEYAPLINVLWLEGDKAQATFWFYVFQSRSRAWSESDTNGSGYSALRASYNDVLGYTINSWVGGDPVAWHEISSRAISYEKKFPFYKGKPENIEQKEWESLLTQERNAYEEDFLKNFPPLTSESLDSMKSIRKQNGLPSGPLEDSGVPLPESWR